MKFRKLMVSNTFTPYTRDATFLVDKGREDPSTTISGLNLCVLSCGDPESFVREGPNMTTVFFMIRGGRIQVPL